MFRYAVAVMFLMLCACASAGTEMTTDPNRLARLEVGATDKSDAYYLLGQPHHVDITRSASEWVYYQSRSHMDPWTLVPVVGLIRNGSQYEVQSTILTFDAQDTLTRYVTDEQSFYSSTWATYGAMYDGQTLIEPVRLEMQRLDLPFNEQLARQMNFYSELMSSRDQAQ